MHFQTISALSTFEWPDWNKPIKQSYSSVDWKKNYINRTNKLSAIIWKKKKKKNYMFEYSVLFLNRILFSTSASSGLKSKSYKRFFPMTDDILNAYEHTVSSTNSECCLCISDSFLTIYYTFYFLFTQTQNHIFVFG